MLSHQDNELITRTGPGTPMGEYLRRYWVPACCRGKFRNRTAHPCA